MILQISSINPVASKLPPSYPEDHHFMADAARDSSTLADTLDQALPTDWVRAGDFEFWIRVRNFCVSYPLSGLDAKIR